MRTASSSMVNAVLLCLLVVTAVGGGRTEEAERKWSQHYQVFKLFACGVPQPRSIRVEKLLSGQLEPSETVVPPATVLHRCDSGSGCCSQSTVCKVAEEEQVELHFYIINSIKRAKPVFRPYMVANHTRCSCQSFTNDIK